MNENVPILIASAMSAWNEVYQGYPDHWAKVTGDLMLASEICDTELGEQLEDEAKKFSHAFTTGEMYRPPFEVLAVAAVNACGGDVDPKEVQYTQLCYDCATKHLSDAGLSWNNMEMGDFNAFLDVIGNMSHAANHLIERHPDLANAIRGDRKTIWESFVKRQAYPESDVVKRRIMSVIEAAKQQAAIKQSAEKQQDEVKHLIAEAAKRHR